VSPAIAVLSVWLLFGGSHLLLSAPPLRSLLSKRLGQRPFVLFYTLIAAVSLSLLIVAVVRYGGDGVPGPNLADLPAARWTLGGIALIGAVLMIAGLLNYPRSPMSVLARRGRATNNEESKPLPTPGAVERITRHPFFVGLALLMGAHTLLASTLAGTVYFFGFVVLSLIGIPMQDRKLHLRHGDLYGDYLSNSSAMPFAAVRRSSEIVKGRVWPIFAASIAGATMLAVLHPLWRLGHGAPFAALVLIGGLYGVAKQLRHGRNE
jgi:uncharacterized membrane protein